MTLRVDVSSALLEWARQRSKINERELLERFPKLPEWERGDLRPTLKQLERFARATHTPIGFLFLLDPPVEDLPIPDFRTMRDEGVERPSADLLDSIFQSQQRQDWYRGYVEAEGHEPLAFVGSMTTSTDVVEAADVMREALDFDIAARGSSTGDARRALIEHAENIGVLVMVNGVVGSNTHRPLDPEEFRGFALVDTYAPVVFVNGADTMNGQIFTLAHELAHVWLGEEGLSDVTIAASPTNAVERWCNQVAAELLVPLAEFEDEFRPGRPFEAELERVARTYRVSTLVILRRAVEAGHIERDAYPLLYQRELERIREILDERAEAASGGGNFFNTQPLRVSRRFARALIGSTLEGETLRRDALQLLAFKKLSTLNEMATRLGVE